MHQIRYDCKIIVNAVIVEEEPLGAVITYRYMFFKRDDLEAEVDESYEMSFYLIRKEFERLRINSMPYVLLLIQLDG